MITLVEARVHQGSGRRVKYTSAGGETVEEGVITSVGETFVFVRYVGQIASKATHPQDLEWASP